MRLARRCLASLSVVSIAISAAFGLQTSDELDTALKSTRDPHIMTNQMAYEARHEAEFSYRFKQRARGNRQYSPLVDVEGASGYKALATALSGQRTIGSAALKVALSYVNERNTRAFIIWHKGAKQVEQYFGSGTNETLFASGSLAKPLAVLAIGRAMKLGFIDSLDQPAADFFPEWRGTNKAAITIRHLLDMRSGLLAQAILPQPEQHISNRAFLHPAHDEILLNDYPLIYPPGTRYDYVNANLDFVAILIERATGTPYQTFISNQLLKPIGARGGQFWLNRPGGIAHSACCSFFPADTYLRLALLVKDQGRWKAQKLVAETFIREMQTPTLQNQNAGMAVFTGHPYKKWRGPLNPKIKQGQVFHSEPYLSSDLVLFDGKNNQVAYIIPSKDLVIVRLGGRPPKDKIWDNSYLPNTVMRGIIQ